jgi:prepilin-type N-terminal cleavage/methylation domain-containing protein
MTPRNLHHMPRGLTLVELITALAVVTIISLAVTTLLFGANNVNRYTKAQATAEWEGDFAWHRIAANSSAALPLASSGMTPTVTTDSNGQSRLTLIVPDVANNTTRTLKYYCTGATSPYTLVEDDPRYDVASAPNPIAHNVTTFTVTLDATTTLKVWTTLQLTPTTGWPMTRHFCAQCRNF